MQKIVFVACFILYVHFSYGNNDMVISKWLTTGPLDMSYPAFHDTKNVEGDKFTDSDLLVYEPICLKNIKPFEGEEFGWISGQTSSWSGHYADSKDFISFEADMPATFPQVVFIAAYIEAERWLEASLTINTPQMAQVYLNGNPLGKKTTVEHEQGTLGEITQSLKLEKGKHLLLIKSLYAHGSNSGWKVSARLKPGNGFHITDLNIDTKPYRSKTIHDILNGVKVSWVRPSPSGELYAVTYSEAKPPRGDTERWVEIKNHDDNSIIHSFKHASISQLQWLPESRAVSYITRDNNKASLHVFDFEKGKTKTVLEEIERMGSYRWSSNEDFIIFSVTEDNTGEQGHIKHVLGMQDRQPNWRNRSFLYYLDLNTKATHRLTYGNLSTSMQDISRCGEKLLFSQTRPDYQERPFHKHNIFLMDINTLAVDTLWSDKKWGVSGQFSPCGEYMLFTGGPDAFGKAGRNIPEGMIANNYDTQAYIYELKSGKTESITFDFDPSLAGAHWNSVDNHIYFTAQDKDKIRLYRYNFRRDRFSEIPTPVDVVAGINYSSDSHSAAFMGEGMSEPSKGYWLNLRNDKTQLLEDTESENYRYVRFGETREWDYQTSEGVDISGRIYLPPGFDAEQTYPLIVYYYGGTNPVSRRFGGRYPFNLWAGNGYVVYVLQPSGATGFGQEFSAAHVNNWGITVAGEIIESTKAFLEAHRFTDKNRVGCIGASYGGFMTMLLLTQTDIFTTAVSHAGISSIASYWGQGYWGYSYSALATANNYPWNNPEIYFDQSPLFGADKVNTPLLLITGDEDTNVPPGESVQMYTALKILGKPVELLKVKGQNHTILNYEKRIEWNNAILAWFDKCLKEQDEWWKEQFPKKNF